MDIEDPQPNLPRLVPERSLPPYRYVPGRAPHPLRHPLGHLYGDGRGNHLDPPPRDSAQWARVLRYGVDLFNHGFYWEAHETWEGLWRGLSRDAPLAQMLQGLIQAAAAMLKHHMGQPGARARLAAAARQRLLLARDEGCAVVRDLDGFLDRSKSWWRKGPDAQFPTLEVF